MRKIKVWTMAGNVGAGNSLGIIRSLAGLTRFAIHTVSGSVRLLPSLDGTTFDEVPLVLSQEPVIVSDIPDAEGSFLVATNTDRLAWLEGDFGALDVRQVGADAVSIIIRAGGED